MTLSTFAPPFRFPKWVVRFLSSSLNELELCIVCVVDVTWTESVTFLYLVLGFHRVEVEQFVALSL